MREYSKYILRNGKKIVYVGITNDPDRRMQEHSQDKNFTTMQVVGRKTTQDGAKNWETSRLATYRKNHKGTNPRYNTKRDG